jgi:hypothetical protein
MSSNKIIIAVIAFTLLIIVGGLALVSNSGPKELEVTKEVSLVTTETTHDWGNIPINDGKVSKSFEIKNEGQGTLKLNNISTSCMCTTAQVVIGDQKSPYFGMHSNSTWVGELPSGQVANLIVEFDPAFHGPNGVGQATRQILVETNDQENPKLTFNLSGNVIK